jgi:dolichyl-phosphate beta-glucosyltransferase
MPNATIVVPCYNEANRLDLDAFRGFVRRNSDIKFLLVNDGSRDRTQSILEQLAYSHPTQFSVLNLVENSGKAEAVRRGMIEAMADEPEFVGYWDADLATPLEAIPEFVAVLRRCPKISLVMGVRLPLLGHDIRRRPLRRWLGRMFSRVTALVVGLRTQDTQCGAKLFRATPEVQTMFSQPFGSRWIFDVELLARLICLRRETIEFPAAASIFELPLDAWEDVKGSKLKRGDFVKAIAELASIWWRYLRPGASRWTVAAQSASTEKDNALPAKPRRAA